MQSKDLFDGADLALVVVRLKPPVVAGLNGKMKVGMKRLRSGITLKCRVGVVVNERPRAITRSNYFIKKY